MKKSLLVASILATTLTFGQKKINAVVEKQYNDSGTTTNIDSTAFTYNSWAGSLTLNQAQPQFVFEEGIMGYVLVQPIVHCDQDQRFTGSSYPLTAGGITNNTLINGMISESLDGNGTDRDLYEYNAMGQVTKITSESFIGGSWQVQDSSIRTYDALGNKLTESLYLVFSGTGPGLSNTDTLWYEAGTNKVIKGVHYFLNGSSVMEISDQSLISYTGNNVQYVDLYESDGSGGLDWVYRLNYNYSGSQLDDFIAYHVLNNTPTAAVFAEGYFNYTAQNLPSSYSLILGGDTLGQIRWEYDTDGFISKKIETDLDMNGDLYDGYITTYHFQSTAGLNEIEETEVLIYPNPAVDIVYLETENPIINVRLLNQAGQLLIEQNSKEINMEHLPSGTYFVQGTTEKGTFKSKVVKL